MSPRGINVDVFHSGCSRAGVGVASIGASAHRVVYAQKAIQLACGTHPRELPGPGLVRLDTFMVAKKDGFPSDGYWPVAQHDREEWAECWG